MEAYCGLLTNLFRDQTFSVSFGTLKALIYLRYLPFYIIVMAQVVSLLLFLHIIQHNNGSIEVDNLSRRQQEEVRATVSAPVTITDRLG